MNRVMLAIGLVALLVGALGGFLASNITSGRLQGQVRDAEAAASRLQQRVDDLQAQNDRIGAQLKAEQARAQTTEADLQREKEVNARLHVLVSDGRK
jgi:peptidoglycan hydrolase CwlO-like protein